MLILALHSFDKFLSPDSQRQFFNSFDFVDCVTEGMKLFAKGHPRHIPPDSAAGRNAI